MDSSLCFYLRSIINLLTYHPLSFTIKKTQKNKYFILSTARRQYLFIWYFLFLISLKPLLHVHYQKGQLQLKYGIGIGKIKPCQFDDPLKPVLCRIVMDKQCFGSRNNFQSICNICFYGIQIHMVFVGLYLLQNPYGRVNQRGQILLVCIGKKNVLEDDIRIFDDRLVKLQLPAGMQRITGFAVVLRQ